MSRTGHIGAAAVLAGVALFSCPQAASAEPHRKQLDPTNIAMAEPNGELRVEVWRGGRWQLAGSLGFDIYYRAQSLDLAEFLPAAGEVQVRLRAQGLGAAHIDGALLDGQAPLTVAGGGASALTKLRQADYDVLHADGRTLSLRFAEPRHGASLTLTARIEGERVCGSPFQLPPANMRKPMTEGSAFYPYRLGSQPTQAPFAREWAAASTGHPSGYIHLWAHDDGDTLYATLDFTGDNTVDGDADWAEVHVKSPTGLRRFRVSVPDQRWGKPRFTYTDTVPYQHKVYDFAIPFRELGLARGALPDELGLAFGAYGTCALGAEYYGVVHYSPAADRYLIAFNREVGGCNYHAFVQAVDGAGTLVGTAVQASEANTDEEPALAYNSVDDEFLLVWTDQSSQDVMGQRLSTAGAKIGTNFIVADRPIFARRPDVAFDPVTSRYLVAWRDGSASEVRGTLVTADGSIVDTDGDGTPEPGEDHVLIGDANQPDDPAVAFEPQVNRFLVVWGTAAAGRDVYGRLVLPDGNMQGPAFAVSDATGEQAMPSVARIDSTDPLLVLFGNFTAAEDVFGQLVGNDGTLVDHGNDGTPSDDNFAVSTAGADQILPQLAGDTHNQRFLAVWPDARSTAGLYGQLVHGDATLEDHGGNGTAADDNFLITTPASGTLDRGYVAHNPNCQNYLVAYEHSDPIGYAVIGPCLVPSHDYGDAFVSTPVDRTFTLTNTDGGPLAVGTLALSGSHATMFALANDNCSDQTVAADGSCDFDVVLTAASLGALDAEVSVPTDYPSSPTLRLVLAANGVDVGTGGNGGGTAGTGGAAPPPTAGDSGDEGGCGCRVPVHHSSPSRGLAALLALSLLAAARRRRRRG